MQLKIIIGNDFMAFVLTVCHACTMVSSSTLPEDLPVSSALQLSPGDEPKSFDEELPDLFTSAYINITYKDKYGYKWERAEVGRYGGGYIGPASGVLVHVSGDKTPDDHTGCSLPFRSSSTDRQLPPPGEPWIALIKRGRCNFEVKVENAFRSKASGVLVYNDRDSKNLDKMKLSTDSGRNLSAVFTYKWKGEQMAKLLENDSKVFVHVTVSDRPQRTTTINRTSVLFVSVTFIILMIISLAWLVFYYVQRFRYLHAKDRLSRRLCSAAKKALSKIPTKNIKSDDKEVEDGECCAVCIEPYKISDVLRMLPCHHEFHKSCIDPWLLEHRTCPMCKMDILRHYGFMFTGSQESILHMEIEEVVGLSSNDNQDSEGSHQRGISPLPQIRTSSERRGSLTSLIEGEDRSSNVSSADETSPTLPTVRNHIVRQDLCVNCIAAASLVNNPEDALLDKLDYEDEISISPREKQVLSPESVQLTQVVPVQGSNAKDGNLKLNQ